MTALARFEADQMRARDARREAKTLRELHEVASCGLDMMYEYHHVHNGDHYVNLGTYKVPHRIQLRMADQYLVWAAEYDAIADDIERDIASRIREGDPS